DRERVVPLGDRAGHGLGGDASLLERVDEPDHAELPFGMLAVVVRLKDPKRGEPADLLDGLPGPGRELLRVHGGIVVSRTCDGGVLCWWRWLLLRAPRARRPRPGCPSGSPTAGPVPFRPAPSCLTTAG